MAFKMNNPMKKNFGGVLKKAIPPDATGLINLSKSEKGKEAVKNMGYKTGGFLMKKDNVPMMRMDNAAMKAMGQPAPVKMSHPMKQDDDDLDAYVEPGSAEDLANQPDYNKPAAPLGEVKIGMSNEEKNLRNKLKNKEITQAQFDKAISNLKLRES